MPASAKLLEVILGARADAGIRFRELRRLIYELGFRERIRGDHHIFKRSGIEEIINLQPLSGMAKPYQVRQVRALMKSKHEISIIWSDEDDAYIATVPDLPGCMADGRSYQEALAAAERAIELWIETAQELGRSVPEPRARRASV